MPRSVSHSRYVGSHWAENRRKATMLSEGGRPLFLRHILQRILFQAGAHRSRNMSVNRRDRRACSLHLRDQRLDFFVRHAHLRARCHRRAHVIEGIIERDAGHHTRAAEDARVEGLHPRLPAPARQGEWRWTDDPACSATAPAAHSCRRPCRARGGARVELPGEGFGRFTVRSARPCIPPVQRMLRRTRANVRCIQRGYRAARRGRFAASATSGSLIVRQFQVAQVAG